MPNSFNTFTDEYGNLSSISGIFVESEASANEYTQTQNLFYPASSESILGEQSQEDESHDKMFNSNDWRVGEFCWPESSERDFKTTRQSWANTGVMGIRACSIPIDYKELLNQPSNQLTQTILEVVGVDVRKALEEVLEGTGEDAKLNLPIDAEAPCVTDAYGCFAPYHYYHKHPKIHWGIYLYFEPLLKWAARLYLYIHSKGETISFDKAFHLAWFITFRHELFHYHVERFATRQEIAQRKPIYRPYKDNVFRHPSVRGTEDWLEEALAQAVVLRSKLVCNRLGVGEKKLRRWLKNDFRTSFGDGYRHFECKKFGGTNEAHKLLAAQIVTGKQFPGFTSTDIFLPKLEYKNSKESVPAFFAARPNFLTRFQLAGPKTKRWKRYAKKNGFMDTGRRVGDHEIWQKGKQSVHINFKRGEADRASMKAVSSILGQDLRTTLLEAAKC